MTHENTAAPDECKAVIECATMDTQRNTLNT